jgi:hypothetical protein
MDKLCAKLDGMRGKCGVCMHAPTNAVTRFQNEDIHAGIAEFARSSQTCCACAYHQRCHDETYLLYNRLLKH